MATRVMPAVGIAEPVRIVKLRLPFYFIVAVELYIPLDFKRAALLESGLLTDALKLYALMPRLLA